MPSDIDVRERADAVKVYGKGPEDSPFIIIGEAPGRHEVKERKPFVGPSGQVLEYALTKQIPAYQYPEPYFTNVSKTMVTFEKDTSALAALAMDRRPQILEEVKRHPRKVILALGNVALHALTGNTGYKITKARGVLYPSELAEVGIVAALHPAALMRGTGSFRQFKSDVAYAIRLAQGHPPHTWEAPTWSIVQSVEEIQAHADIIRCLPHDSFLAMDVETTGFSHVSDRLLNLGYTWDGKHVYILCGEKTDALNPLYTAAFFNREWKGGHPNLIQHANILFKAAKLGEPGRVRQTWHNGKFDVKFHHQYGHMDARVDDDTLLMSYALDEQRGIHDLETVAGDWLASPNWKGTLDSYKNKNQSYDIIPYPILFNYAAFDIANTFRLARLLWDMILLDPIAHKQYTKSLIPASGFLMDMEKRGILTDQKRSDENNEYYSTEMAPYASAIHKIAQNTHVKLRGEATPSPYTKKLCNSPKQLCQLLYDDLGLKCEKGPTLRTTDVDQLEKLPQSHPIINALLKYRKAQKAFSTYVKPYVRESQNAKKSGKKSYVVDIDGRVHASFLIHGTATGRLSSREPNLQNIPRDPRLRGQFIAGPGRMFIEPDLNQAEIRSLAVLSGDPALCRIYLEGKESLHDVTRKAIFGTPADWTPAEEIAYLYRFNITPETRYVSGKDRLIGEMKMIAKNVNFGIIYGITERGLSEQTGQPIADCKVWLSSWANQFPIAWKFIQACRNAPLFGKNLVTVFGYRKRFNIITPDNFQIIGNEAANMPHQSTASLITMHAGIRTYELLREYDAYYENTVHDSQLINAPQDYAVALAITKLMTSTLEQVPRDWGLTAIPFVADAKWGDRWGSLYEPHEKYAYHMGWDVPQKQEEYA